MYLGFENITFMLEYNRSSVNCIFLCRVK